MKYMMVFLFFFTVNAEYKSHHFFPNVNSKVLGLYFANRNDSNQIVSFSIKLFNKSDEIQYIIFEVNEAFTKDLIPAHKDHSIKILKLESGGMVSISCPINILVKNNKDYGKVQKNNMHLIYYALTLKDNSFPLKFHASNIKTRSPFIETRTFYGELLNENKELAFTYHKGASKLDGDSFEYTPRKCCGM